MIKTPALLICILLCAYFGNAQKIYFSDSTNRWKIVNSSCGGDEHPPVISIENYSGDTTINNLSYKVLSINSYSTPGPYIFIREDTNAKKVFAISPSYPTYDTVEELLYDYNLQLGDTFICKFATHVVSSIDTVTINSDVYKIWHLVSTSNSPNYDVVEGIGCTNGPVFPLYPSVFEECYFESCFENKGINPPFSHSVGTFNWEFYLIHQWGTVHYDNTSSCNENFHLDVKSITKPDFYSGVVPNPVAPGSKIVLPYSISSGTLYITNEVGEVVEQTSFHNRKELNIGSLIKLPGFYCYRVVDAQSGKVFTGKFVY